MFNFLKYFRYGGRSWKWKDVRKKHLETQNSCQACGREDNLEVHHIVPVHVDENKELDPTNLITLCGKTCHLMFGHLMDYKSWNPNVEEDSNLYLSKIKKRPYHDKSN